MKNVRLLASIAVGSMLLSATALAQEVDKKAVATANIKLAYDEESGFFGSEVRGSEHLLQVTEYDRNLAVSSDGTYRIMAPPKKVLLPRKLLFVGVFDSEKGKDFTLVYRDGERNARAMRRHER